MRSELFSAFQQFLKVNQFCFCAQLTDLFRFYFHFSLVLLENIIPLCFKFHNSNRNVVRLAVLRKMLEDRFSDTGRQDSTNSRISKKKGTDRDKHKNRESETIDDITTRNYNILHY